jgi:hypothetical protein
MVAKVTDGPPYRAAGVSRLRAPDNAPTYDSA